MNNDSNEQAPPGNESDVAQLPVIQNSNNANDDSSSSNNNNMNNGTSSEGEDDKEDDRTVAYPIEGYPEKWPKEETYVRVMKCRSRSAMEAIMNNDDNFDFLEIDPDQVQTPQERRMMNNGGVSSGDLRRSQTEDERNADFYRKMKAMNRLDVITAMIIHRYGEASV